MDVAELVKLLDEHDALVMRFVENGLSFAEFVESYDCFYPRAALDGHEGFLDVLASFESRIVLHRRIWDEVLTQYTEMAPSSHPNDNLLRPEAAADKLRSVVREFYLSEGPL